MQTRRLEESDTAITVSFLEEHLESSLFLLHNIERGGVVFGDRPYQAEYLGAFRHNSLIGVVAHTWLNTLLVQAPSFDALGMLEEAIPSQLERPVVGLLGPREQCLELMERLACDRGAAALDLDEPLYVLELDRLPTSHRLRCTELRFREASASDVEVLCRWRLAYVVEVLQLFPSELLRRRIREEMTRAIEERHAFVLDLRGQAVAFCAFNSVMRQAVQLGGVWVPPRWRRHGFGSLVMAAALERARDLWGKARAAVTVDDGNRPALSLCESLGFMRSGRFSFTMWSLEEGVGYH